MCIRAEPDQFDGYRNAGLDLVKYRLHLLISTIAWDLVRHACLICRKRHFRHFTFEQACTSYFPLNGNLYISDIQAHMYDYVLENHILVTLNIIKICWSQIVFTLFRVNCCHLYLIVGINSLTIWVCTHWKTKCTLCELHFFYTEITEAMLCSVRLNKL